jgi:hypothetical protein
MPEIGTSGLMSGEGKRNAFAIPRLSSTLLALMSVVLSEEQARFCRCVFHGEVSQVGDGVGCWRDRCVRGRSTRRVTVRRAGD